MPFQIDPSSQYLDRQLFMSILQYEELLLDGQFNREIVENLISLYAQCVEFYDSIKDPIKFYFLEKMQIILCHEQTLKEIVTPKNKEKSIDKYQKQKIQKEKNVIIDDDFKNEVLHLQRQENNQDLIQNFNEIIQSQQNQDSFDEKEDEDSNYQDLDNFSDQQFSQSHISNHKETKLSLQQMKLKYKQNCRSQIKYSISKKRLERSKRVGMYLQIHQESNINQAETMGSLFQSFVDNNEKQANQVKLNLNQQQQEVERRLQRRKTLKEGGQNNVSLALKQTNQVNEKSQRLNKEIKVSYDDQDLENLDPDEQSIN
ncbi:hypothetical protein TTHERM_00372490 (macronuclear) [Tetrahymena thermophila SB210]|uniref:Uncharacterized protein n=1 Tax=Tetrahymena thermophila (strain SB210) TaxID=312017 RepID=I7M0L3_TETTS|nr:hypothetical protein TTHERM_00372490 [Tetrahymena thermophila SB210]EAR89332.2 hypothetical protein TTHERM_00372490 [Tetrahymena thermophila SB210]|eukprot:XP_001009577.2 hypothetical protein TTHERM_00372490 [Tetrahymena thermophila SB210]